jgi:hypothetical protein
MQTRYVWRIVRDVAARAGLTTTSGRRVTPHALRRTFATEMLNRGVRLETVSRLFGHATTTITEQAYAQLTDHRIRAEVEDDLSTDQRKPLAPDKTTAVLTLPTKSTLDRTLRLHGGSKTTGAKPAHRSALGPRAGSHTGVSKRITT